MSGPCIVCESDPHDRRGFYGGYCRTCRREIYSEANPGWLRKKHIESTYNITYDGYCKMYQEQTGECAICGETIALFSEKGSDVQIAFVDHDHETGEVRGLLCRGCNYGLGNFKDSEERLISAIKYLDKQ